METKNLDIYGHEPIPWSQSSTSSTEAAIETRPTGWRQQVLTAGRTSQESAPGGRAARSTSLADLARERAETWQPTRTARFR